MRSGIGCSGPLTVRPPAVLFVPALTIAKPVLDKTQSIYQGRPTRLRSADSSAIIKFLDEFDELEPFHSLSFHEAPSQLTVPTHGVSTFRHLCELMLVVEDVCSTMYSASSARKDPNELHRLALNLEVRLEQWRKSFPLHLTLTVEDFRGFAILPDTLSLVSVEPLSSLSTADSPPDRCST